MQQQNPRKKNCNIHQIPIKYVCKQQNCDQISHLICAECMIQGPHNNHEFIQYELFEKKLGKVLQKTKMYAQELQKVNNIQLMKSQPDLQIATMTGLTNKLFQPCKDISKQILENLQDQFMEKFDKIQQKQFKSPSLQFYEDLDHIYKNIINPQVNVILVPRNQLQQITQVIERPDDYLADMFTEEKQQKQKKDNNKELDNPNNEDFMARATKIVERKIPGLQELFNEFLLQTAQPYIDSILNEIDYSDNVGEYQKKKQPFDFNNYNNQCISSVNMHESGTTEFCKIDENHIATASHDKMIKVWNVNTHKVIKIINDNVEGSIISVIKMGKSLISAGYDKSIRFHDIQNQFQLKSILKNVHDDCLISLTKLNERFFASASDDKLIKVWSYNEFSKKNIAKKEFTLEGHTDCVKSICSVGNDLIVSGGADNTVKVWNWQDQTLLHDFNQHKDWVRCVTALSSSEAASGGNDQTVIIWNCRKGQMLKHIVGIHSGSVCAMIPLGENWLLSCSFGQQGKLTLVNWRNGETVKQTVSGNAGFHSLVQINEKTIVQGMGDGVIKVFN